MFYLNTSEQLFLLVEQLDQLEACLPYSRLLAGIPMLAVFQTLRSNSNKTSLSLFDIKLMLNCELMNSASKIEKCDICTMWFDVKFELGVLEHPFSRTLIRKGFKKISDSYHFWL